MRVTPRMSTVGTPDAVPWPIATEPAFSMTLKLSAAGFQATNWVAKFCEVANDTLPLASVPGGVL